MRTLTSITLSLITLIMFTQCASSQFDKKPPFTVDNAKHQKWIGGKPGSNGTLVNIELTETVSNNISFDSIYFNGEAVRVSVNSLNGKTTISGRFSTNSYKDRPLIIDSDPKKEFGNKAPILPQKIPFELAKNECVISYTINNKKHYYKLGELKKGKMIIHQ